MSTSSSLSTREHIFETASSLFYRLGYQAVGVDQIADDAEVGKMTLYRHFPSKDHLIEEHLKRSSDEFWRWFDDAASQATDPTQRILSVFDAIETQCRSAMCVGCTFQSAAAEFPDRQHPINKISREHKQAVRSRLELLLSDTGIRECAATANQLMLLMEGAWAATRLLSLPNPAREVSAAARSVIEAQLQAESLEHG